MACGEPPSTAMRTYWGSKIILYRKPYTVIGVMPRDFELSAQPGACEQQRALASAQPRARRIYGRQRSVVELSHGRALKPGIIAEQRRRPTADRSGLEPMLGNDAGL